MTRIILHGCMGKLGTAIHALAKNDPHCEIVCGVDIAGSGDGLAFPVYSDISLCNQDADVIMDCSVVSAVPALLKFGQARKLPTIVCTTGLPQEILSEIEKTAESIAILRSANMSLGINLLENMVGRAAKLLGDFDIEIIEKHHKQKVDAPSGTALVLADAVNRALGGDMEYKYDRTEARKKRGGNEIGIHSLRGGTIIGEHSVVFAGLDEVIEFKHQVYSKEVFAVGALKAARFMHGRAPGCYSMQDMIDDV